MNIFLVDKDPAICAQALDNLRLNKMLLETAQLLCGAYRRLWLASDQPVPDILYKDTHANHPCAIWARSSSHNYRWLIEYFFELEKEWEYRGRAPHASFTRLWQLLQAPAFALVTPAEPTFTFDCSNVDKPGSIISRYRECLNNKWNMDLRIPNWGNRGEPEWRT